MSFDVPGVRQYTSTEALGVSARRLNPSDPEGSTCVGIPALRGDPAGDWLKANDPLLSADGVADEIKAALADEALSVDEARSVFRKSGGRPSRALVGLRGRVARALLPIWEEGRRRDHMAQALECDRKTLGRLMAKPPHAP